MFTYSALGVGVGFEVEDEGLGAQLDRALASLAAELEPKVIFRLLGAGTTVDPMTLVRDGERLATFETAEAALTFAVHCLNRFAIEHTNLLAIHAGAVSLDGHAAVFPGDQGVGKTTLTAGLVRAGCQYLTDEATAFADTGPEILPYPKPLSLSRESLALLSMSHESEPREDRHVPTEDLRSGSLGSACPMRWLIFPSYDPTARTRLDPIGKGAAVIRLAENTFGFANDPSGTLTRVADLTRAADCFRLRSGDLAEAVAVVIETMQRR